MSFYPILKAPNTSGFTTLHNFSPNNWELDRKLPQIVSLTYLKDSVWHSRQLNILEVDQSKTFYATDIEPLVPNNALSLLSLSTNSLPEKSEQIPNIQCSVTNAPLWRSTLGLSSQYTTVSYQGELPVFPTQASLLSFSPFLQFEKDVKNYVLLVNIEKKPLYRDAEIEIYDAKDKILLGTRMATTNQINIISLDEFDFNEKSLPIVICREMAAIPIYFSTTKNGEFLSLEHSHPPASFVTHGERFKMQKYLKEFWFSQLQR